MKNQTLAFIWYFIMFWVCVIGLAASVNKLPVGFDTLRFVGCLFQLFAVFYSGFKIRNIVES